MMRARKQEKLPIPQPPAHLSDKAKALWFHVVPSRCRSRERLAFLAEALQDLDRSYEIAELIKAEGWTTTTKRSGVTHLNPLTKLCLEYRRLFYRAWKELGLTYNYDVDGRLFKPEEWDHNQEDKA